MANGEKWEDPKEHIEVSGAGFAAPALVNAASLFARLSDKEAETFGYDSVHPLVILREQSRKYLLLMFERALADLEKTNEC